MKRILAIALCLTLCICFCACDLPFIGKDDDSQQMIASTQPTTETPSEAQSTTVAEETSQSTTDTTAATAATNASLGSLDKLNNSNSNSSNKSQSVKPTPTNRPAATSNKNENRPAPTSKKVTSYGNSNSAQQQTSLVYKPGEMSTFASVQNSGHLYNSKKNTIITTARPSATNSQNNDEPQKGGQSTPPASSQNTTSNGGGQSTPPASSQNTTSNGGGQSTTADENSTNSTVKVPSGGTSKSGVITYPTSPDLKTRNDISFKANGIDVALYDVRVNHNHYYNANTVTSTTPVAMFEMTEAVNVEITYPSAVTSAVVLPSAEGITPTVSGNTVSFTISKAGKFSVEINNNVNDAVLIFADDPHIAPSGNVTIKEAGTHIGYVTAREGDTVYLAPGAVIRGTVDINTVKDVKICGRGIIDGSIYDSWIKGSSYARLPVKMWQGDNIELDGFFIFDSNCWGIEVQNTNNVKINNVKIMTARPNGDGISLQSTHDVTVTNCFVRTWDDSLVVKNYELPLSYNIKFQNCVVWNDLANAMEIGFETNKAGNPNPKMYDISFEDIYVIHGLANSIISIHNGDNAAISDITYKNIYVDDSRASAIFDISNNYSNIWSKVQERGTIKNVTFENFTVDHLSLKQTSKVDASQGAITGISIKNYTLEGKKVTSAEDAGMKVIGGAGVSFS